MSVACSLVRWMRTSRCVAKRLRAREKLSSWSARACAQSVAVSGRTSPPPPPNLVHVKRTHLTVALLHVRDGRLEQGNVIAQLLVPHHLQAWRGCLRGRRPFSVLG